MDSRERSYRQFFIRLPKDRYPDLSDLAWEEGRTPKEQASVLLVEALERRVRLAARRRERQLAANGSAST
jgi:hypothetical protein